jgi:hypothetical protein
MRPARPDPSLLIDVDEACELFDISEDVYEQMYAQARKRCDAYSAELIVRCFCSELSC